MVIKKQQDLLPMMVIGSFVSDLNWRNAQKHVETILTNFCSVNLESGSPARDKQLSNQLINHPSRMSRTVEGDDFFLNDALGGKDVACLDWEWDSS